MQILLATVALGAAHHEATSGARPVALLTFLSTEGNRHQAARRTVKRKPIAARPTYTVTATVYQAVAGQTDDEPFVTADNSRIKPHYGSKTRWLALSNDLLARWGGHFQYGDKVRVRGISPQLDGVYTVHDTMNKRHHHCIDILTHPSEKLDIFTPDVKLQLVLAAVRPAPDQPLATLPPPAARSRVRTRAAIAKARPAPHALSTGPRPRVAARYKKEVYFASAIL